MAINAGDVFAMRINPHRHRWNGEICSEPTAWNCTATLRFRDDHCNRGDARCFHIHVFDKAAPRFVTPDETVIRLVGEHKDVFEDQLIIFYGKQFGLTTGVAAGETDDVVFGMYRAKRAILRESRLQIIPHEEGWTLFPPNFPRRPFLQKVEGLKYLHTLRGVLLEELLSRAVDTRRADPRSGWTSDHQSRFDHFKSKAPEWLKIAHDRLSGHPATNSTTQSATLQYFTAPAPIESDFARQLKALNVKPSPATPELPTPQVVATEEDVVSAIVEEGEAQAVAEEAPSLHAEPPPTPEPEHPKQTQLPEPAQKKMLEEIYGKQLVTALSVAFTSKPIVILTGPPGVGKSRLASQLISDPQRARSVVVPVGSTWRGREDLIGYVNPINGKFEPTDFTRFLIQSAQAWDEGDRKCRLVILEEFNLSQPEHWLSDLLVRLEYDTEQRADRTVTLGGSEIAGFPGVPTNVFLPPTLYFVATLNSDHTVRPLSPRVLDRAALVEMSLTGRSALRRLGVELPSDVEDAIEELNELLELRGISFSVRSSRSLLRLLARCDEIGLSQTQALDYVLEQEVLSKVRLMAGDPRDEKLLDRLEGWTAKSPGNTFVQCAEKIEGWRSSLSAGHDVFQA